MSPLPCVTFVASPSFVALVASLAKLGMSLFFQSKASIGHNGQRKWALSIFLGGLSIFLFDVFCEGAEIASLLIRISFLLMTVVLLGPRHRRSRIHYLSRIHNNRRPPPLREETVCKVE